jgi:hypothetical protein
MIIHQPELLLRDGQSIVHARIEMQQARERIPAHLWFRVPEQYTQHLTLQSDAFLIPGLVAGMHFKEDIEVRGTVSPKLAYNLEEYQNLLHFRFPKSISPVEIRYDHLRALAKKPEAVGTTFSGGVDSFFTLWKHLPQNQPIPGFQITHALFLLGFDILNKDKPRYEALYARYRKALQEINVTLIPIESNLVSMIIPRMKLPHFYGPVLGGVAHLFGNLFKRFYIPSSKDYWQIKRMAFSSDPTSDPLLSTETMDIIHHGAAIQRVEKVEAMCGWELPQAQLRVCFSNDLNDEMINCSRCEKCVRTMIPIYALGKMDNFKTFEKPFTTNSAYLWWARKFDPSRDYVIEMFPFVRRVRPRLMPWLRMAALAGYMRYWLVKLTPKPAQRVFQRFGYFVDLLTHENAFEDPELTEFLKAKDA